MSRERCPECLRPKKTCLCVWLKPMLPEPFESALSLVILQHPNEEFQAKGTGRLLHLCVRNSHLVVSELLTEPLRALLSDSKQDILLFPEPADAPASVEKISIGALKEAPEEYRVWLLDGTWRKARKMVYLNSELHALPKLDLAEHSEAPLVGRYGIRKAEKPGQLSTFEAASHVLNSVNDASVSDTLDRVFSEFIARQKQFLSKFIGG